MDARLPQTKLEWAIVVGGVAAGYLLIRYYNKRNDDTGEEDEVSEEVTDYTSPVTYIPTTPTTPTYIPPSEPGEEAPLPGISQYDDNNDWEQAAIFALQKKGHRAIESTLAINRYLNGIQLSDTDTHIVNEAVELIGPPPDIPENVLPYVPKPVTPTPVTPKPVTPTPVTPKPVTPKPKPTIPKDVGPWFRAGQWSYAIGEMEKKLIKLGYQTSKVDNYYGPSTVTAVTKLQKEHKLAVHGSRAGAQVMYVLNGGK